MIHNSNSLPVGGSDAWELWNIARGDDAPQPPAALETGVISGGEATLSLLGLRLVTEADIPTMPFRRRPLEDPADHTDSAVAEA